MNICGDTTVGKSDYNSYYARLISTTEYLNLSLPLQNQLGIVDRQDSLYVGRTGVSGSYLQGNIGYVPSISSIRVLDENSNLSWLCDDSIGIWWSMNSYSFTPQQYSGFVYDAFAYGVDKDFSYSYTPSTYSAHIRPVITVKK